MLPFEVQYAFVNLRIIIYNAMAGQETEKVPFSFISRSGQHVDCLLSVSKKVGGCDHWSFLLLACC